MHTRLDLRGSIPSFIHISNGKLHDVNVLDVLIPKAGAIYVMDRGYLDFERLCPLHQVLAFFVTRANLNLDARHVYSAATDRATGIICDQTIALSSHSRQHYPAHMRRIRFKDPESGKTRVVPHQQLHAAGNDRLRALQEPLACGAVLQVNHAVSSYQEVPRHVGACGEVADLDRRVGVCPRQEAPRSGCAALHVATDSVGHPVREDALAASLSRQRPPYPNRATTATN
jgi:hypothetical protein